MIELRDYQQTAVDEIRLEFGKRNQPVLFVLSTGGGKTYTFSYIAFNAALRNNPTIIIVHRKELLIQASASLRNLGIDHGIISPHFTPNPAAMVQVASIDTLLIKLKDRKFNFGLVIFDEAHHVTADNKWGRVYEALGQPPMLGVTATPCRTDGQGLGVEYGGLFRTMVKGPPVTELIARGMLLNPKIYTACIPPDMTGVKKSRNGDYDLRALANRVDKPVITGSAVEQYEKVCPRARTIVFCVNINHARNVVEEFNSAGYRFDLLVGQPAMSNAERTTVNRRLRNGDLDGVCTVDLVSEGYDLPGLECCIMLRPTASLGLYLQQVGRIMRPAPGKEQCWLLDHVGNVGAVKDGVFTLKHGFPDEDREWTLEGSKHEKRKSPEEERGEPVAQCPVCFHVHAPAEFCPMCGHRYEQRRIEQVDGELTEITTDIRLQKRREQGKCRTLEELQSYAALTGKHPNWALHVWNARMRKAGKFHDDPHLSVRIQRMVSAFSKFNVTPAMLVDYRDRPFEQFSDMDVTELSAVYKSLQNGISTTRFFRLRSC